MSTTARIQAIIASASAIIGIGDLVIDLGERLLNLAGADREEVAALRAAARLRSEDAKRRLDEALAHANDPD